MTDRFRLKGHSGTSLTFTFNNRRLVGKTGDTLASALLANGVHLLARSFKYHRPRGILSAGVEESHGIVAVGSAGRLDTNTQATCVELFDGLEARSLNAWPSVRWDALALLGRISRFFPAGFYYKTFFWPSWHWFEGPIRRAAGLGVAPAEPDPDRHERHHTHCDLLIVGSGPAGLAAALAAGRVGVDVIVAEQDNQLGGTLLWEQQSVDGVDGAVWVRTVVAELEGLPNVRLMPKTSVTSYLDHNLLLALERTGAQKSNAVEQLWYIRAARVVLATGAMERPLVFPDNDRPGIMLASAVRQYAIRHRVAVGHRVVVVTNNDDAYRTADALTAAGITVAAIVDSRNDAKTTRPGIPIHRGAVLVSTRGRHRVRRVVARTLDRSMTWTIDCDAVAMSGGWNPCVQLFCQSGGTLRYDEDAAAFVPAAPVPCVDLAGSATGASGLRTCLVSGFGVGSAAAESLGRTARQPPPWRAEDLESDGTVPMWQVATDLAGNRPQWVDFHNDVTDADIALAARENFTSVEHLKRYTTLGMGPDQGKTSNINGLALLGEKTGRAPGQVGTTTFRPPFTPVSFGAIAGRNRGRLLRPSKRLPTDCLQSQFGAKMEDYGAWLRPAFYTTTSETMEHAVRREVGAVRRSVGILDYSPLGKIEVSGTDSLRFLNGMIATNLATLKIGSCRYNLTLNEEGVITDDGIVSRLAENFFVMGTTSGAADRIVGVLDEWRQREYPELAVEIVNVTAQWAVLMLSGPKARALLARTDLDIDLSPGAFTHMTIREGVIGGVPARVSRVSFTGELSFEVAVPTGYAVALWNRFFAAGADVNLTPIGIEALDVLRIEKGFIHVGADTDGTTTPGDVGYDAMIRNKKTDFIGKRSLALPAMKANDRLQIIGLKPLDGNQPLTVGAQLAMSNKWRQATSSGHVTSSVWSPTLSAPVALGMLIRGRDRMGERLYAWSNKASRPVEVVDSRRYDPQGALLNG